MWPPEIEVNIWNCNIGMMYIKSIVFTCFEPNVDFHFSFWPYTDLYFDFQVIWPQSRSLFNALHLKHDVYQIHGIAML